MTYEPTEAEVEHFKRWLASEASYDLPLSVCKQILRHYEPRTREQRCNRSGYLYGRVLMGDPGPVEQRCPGCVNCAVEPAKDGGLTRGVRESVTTGGTGVAQPTTSPVAPIKQTGDRKCGNCGCLSSRHLANSTGQRNCFDCSCPEFVEPPAAHSAAPITIALDDRTLRALMAAVMAGHCQLPLKMADRFLAEIDKAKEESK